MRRRSQRKNISSRHTDFRRTKPELADKQESWKTGQPNLKFNIKHEK